MTKEEMNAVVGLILDERLPLLIEHFNQETLNESEVRDCIIRHIEILLADPNMAETYMEDARLEAECVEDDDIDELTRAINLRLRTPLEKKNER